MYNKIKWNYKKIISNTRTNIIILLVFALLASCSMILVRSKMMANAYDMGNSLARNYAAEEENNITFYKTLLNMGAQYIDENLDTEGYENIEVWVMDYFENIKNQFGSEVELYAVLDGKYVSMTQWDSLGDYNYLSTEWYKQVMDADGEVIFTDLYTDFFTYKRVITIAKKAHDSDSILAMDIFPEDFNVYDDNILMPDNGSYYLCDNNGGLIYYQTDINKTYDDFQEFIVGVLGGIESGEFDAYNATTIDLDGNSRGVYYYKMSNGWTSVLTIPVSSILDKMPLFYILLFLIFLVLFLLIIFVTYKDYVNNKEFERARDTIQVLGNTYYAIYRANYNDGTYEAIKMSDYVKSRHIGKTGDYDTLLNVLSEVVYTDAVADFKESFSIKHIQKLVAAKIKNYGGDFQRRFDDGYKWVNVRLLFDDILAPGEVVLCFRMVDYEKKVQLEQLELLKNALQSARRSEEAKNAFFNSMSHDMRTPLNAIIGFTDLAIRNIDDKEKVLEYFSKIGKSGRQLLGLINDLLEISRLENGKVSLDYKPIDLKKCIQECTDLFTARAIEENKKFDVSFDIFDNMVIGDAFRIGQIMNNLLSNAFKYSKSGAQITVTVQESKYLKYTKYQIIIEDTGIGMTKEFLDTIFEPYSREARFGIDNVVGTGLGMSIVKSLVQQMSGEISVESELGKGSRFTVTIPMEIAEFEKSNYDTEQEKGDDNFDFSGLRILLAEDNEINMEITTEILSSYNVEITPAWNGLEAVRTFKKSKLYSFDAILMDMQMPEMDGCAAAREIRALDREDAKTIPIIAVTANAFAEDVAKTREAGMNAHISKPIDFEILGRTLKDLIK